MLVNVQPLHRDIYRFICPQICKWQIEIIYICLENGRDFLFLSYHTQCLYYYIVSATFVMSQETRNTKIIKVLSMGSEQL
jgi:hypothetical protein